MIDRIIEIASPARLRVRDAQLVIETPEQGQLALPFTTPMREIAVLLLAHPQVTLSQAVLSGIAACGGSVVTIDGAFLPASMLLPLQAHYVQTERFAMQAQLGLPARKRLWQEIVMAKIRAQGELLAELRGGDGGLGAMAARVRSGDPDNLEAQAARRYWTALFPGKPRFRRGSGEPDQNRHLDYGYTVLRAAAARALCAAGLHPSLGLHHSNRYDPFSLAADFMEPFRPLVDRRVSQWIACEDPSGPLDKRAKAWVLGAVTDRYSFERQDRTLFDILTNCAQTRARSIVGELRACALPSLLKPCFTDASGKRDADHR